MIDHPRSRVANNKDSLHIVQYLTRYVISPSGVQGSIMGNSITSCSEYLRSQHLDEFGARLVSFCDNEMFLIWWHVMHQPSVGDTWLGPTFIAVAALCISIPVTSATSKVTSLSTWALNDPTNCLNFVWSPTWYTHLVSFLVPIVAFWHVFWHSTVAPDRACSLWVLWQEPHIISSLGSRFTTGIWVSSLVKWSCTDIWGKAIYGLELRMTIKKGMR